MRWALVAVLVSGCTIAGGIAGARGAQEHNEATTSDLNGPVPGSAEALLAEQACEQRDAGVCTHDEPEHRSVAGYAAAGALVGLAMDVLIWGLITNWGHDIPGGD